MKIIKELSEMILEEIDDAEKYAKHAMKVAEEFPQLSSTFKELAEQEMHHSEMLHKRVTEIIAKHREKHGEPPAAMLAVYEYLYEKHIEKAATANAEETVIVTADIPDMAATHGKKKRKKRFTS